MQVFQLHCLSAHWTRLGYSEPLRPTLPTTWMLTGTGRRDGHEFVQNISADWAQKCVAAKIARTRKTTSSQLWGMGEKTRKGDCRRRLSLRPR